MFRSLRDDGAEAPRPEVTLAVDGEPCTVPSGATVAAALLQRGSIARLTARSGSARAPYCMMGICFDCLVEIDGVPNRQACMVVAEPGMDVRCQDGHRRVGLEPAR
ncbi:MAG: (2Fe-2S)-binding protein [bacterium]|jgi:predicted molibdopterin-dependent oxidoreductase YjgC|nr:(2Fe-2S)-binding protein [Betaproteobacteria bacterium]